MELKEKIKELRDESNELIKEVRNVNDWDLNQGEKERELIDKKIASLKRRSLYLYKKVTGDKKRKFKCITSVLDALGEKDE